MFQKLLVLKEHFSKSLWCSIILIECGPAVHSLHFHQNQRSAENSDVSTGKVETAFTANMQV